MKPHHTRIAIGLGTNLGDRLKNLQAAVERICQDVLVEPQASPVYETEPWGITDQPHFLNAVLVGETEWQPAAILNYLKITERELGRTDTVKNGPRVIDLDLLVYGAETFSGEGVEVPHPGMPTRDFVLVPLVQVWPAWVHPRLKLTAEKLLAALPSPTAPKLSAKASELLPPDKATR